MLVMANSSSRRPVLRRDLHQPSTCQQCRRPSSSPASTPCYVSHPARCPARLCRFPHAVHAALCVTQRADGRPLNMMQRRRICFSRLLRRLRVDHYCGPGRRENVLHLLANSVRLDYFAACYEE